MENQKVIIRGEKSGVYFGTLKNKKGKEVTLTNVRNIWRWEGACSILQLAKDGVSKPKECKFTVCVDELTIIDCIGIIPCTEKAVINIENVPVWKK
jgi:hypothetical protein